MSVSVQQRGERFQLRVKHRLLPRPFFFTFDNEAAARSYGDQLAALLAEGIVPSDLLARPATVDDPLVVEIVRAYTKDSPALTASDDVLLGVMLPEVVALRLSGLTYAWVEGYVRKLKVESNLSPGTIRKRVGALGRVIDWQLRRTNSTAANPLRLLPRGYSQYTSTDRAALPLKATVKRDVQRDRRLEPGEEAAIRPHLGELALLFDVLIGAGLRLREAYTLRADQVDTRRGLLLVAGTKGHRGERKPRTVPLVHLLAAALADHCKGRVGLLWAFWDGTPADLKPCTAKLSRAFDLAFRAAGVVDLTSHDLRHEACCRWVEHKTGNGWTFSDVEICRIMGWSSLAMMLRYASLRGEDLAARLRPEPAG